LKFPLHFSIKKKLIVFSSMKRRLDMAPEPPAKRFAKLDTGAAPIILCGSAQTKKAAKPSDTKYRSIFSSAQSSNPPEHNPRSFKRPSRRGPRTYHVDPLMPYRPARRRPSRTIDATPTGYAPNSHPDEGTRPAYQSILPSTTNLNGIIHATPAPETSPKQVSKIQYKSIFSEPDTSPEKVTKIQYKSIFSPQSPGSVPIGAAQPAPCSDQDSEMFLKSLHSKTPTSAPAPLASNTPPMPPVQSKSFSPMPPVQSKSFSPMHPVKPEPFAPMPPANPEPFSTMLPTKTEPYASNPPITSYAANPSIDYTMNTPAMSFASNTQVASPTMSFTSNSYIKSASFASNQQASNFTSKLHATPYVLNPPVNIPTKSSAPPKLTSDSLIVGLKDSDHPRFVRFQGFVYDSSPSRSPVDIGEEALLQKDPKNDLANNVRLALWTAYGYNGLLKNEMRETIKKRVFRRAFALQMLRGKGIVLSEDHLDKLIRLNPHPTTMILPFYEHGPLAHQYFMFQKSRLPHVNMKYKTVRTLMLRLIYPEHVDFYQPKPKRKKAKPRLKKKNHPRYKIAKKGKVHFDYGI